MVGEILLGLFSLALGVLCLSYAFRHRRLGHPGLTPRGTKRDAEDDKPAMIIPIILGALFLGTGKALLVMALVELF